MKIIARTLTRAFFVMAMIVAGLALAAAPASADSHLHYRLDSVTFTPLLRGQGSNPGDAACQYRLRYGNFGNVAFAQLRVYDGGCGGYNVQVRAASGATYQNWSSSGSPTGNSDGCGSYFEIQATSAANWIAVSGIAVSGRPSPNKIYYHFDHPNYLTQPAIPSSLIIRHCDGS